MSAEHVSQPPPADPTDGVLRLMECAQRAKSEDDLLSDLAQTIAHITHADACDILLRDAGEGLTLRASTTAPEFNNRVKLGKGVGLCGQALMTGETTFIQRNAEQHGQYAKYPGIDDPHCEALAVLPLFEADRAFGVCLLRRGTQWPFSPSLKTLCRKLADALALAFLGYHRAYAEGATNNRLGALSEVSKTISTSPYVEEILQLLVNLTAQQFDYKVCTVRLLDTNSNELILRATQATAKAYQRKRAIKLGESIAGRAIAENRPIIVSDVQVEADYIGHDLAVQQGLRSMICVPLTLQERTVGVLSCYTGEVREFSPDEIKALETLAKQAAVSIEHAKLQVRSTLMQEMHHRVKNNLQQIASLLRLQLRQSHYRSLEEALNDCLSRILAIAAVHDLLSREDLDHVGVRSVAESLIQHQKNSLLLPGRQIQFELRGEDVRLNMMQATQVALVLNELIQNAVEHGFRTSESGDIHVTIEEKEDEVALFVSNNGDQLPPGFDMAHSSHLGLQIVDSLSKALGGKFKIADILGWTVAEVKFMRASSE